MRPDRRVEHFAAIRLRQFAGETGGRVLMRFRKKVWFRGTTVPGAIRRALDPKMIPSRWTSCRYTLDGIAAEIGREVLHQRRQLGLGRG